MKQSKCKKEISVEINNKNILDNGIEIGELARGPLVKYENLEYQEDLSKMINQTEKLLNQAPNIIKEASFTFEITFVV